jgi:hypothetical protein
MQAQAYELLAVPPREGWRYLQRSQRGVHSVPRSPLALQWSAARGHVRGLLTAYQTAVPNCLVKLCQKFHSSDGSIHTW